MSVLIYCSKCLTAFPGNAQVQGHESEAFKNSQYSLCKIVLPESSTSAGFPISSQKRSHGCLLLCAAKSAKMEKSRAGERQWCLFVMSLLSRPFPPHWKTVSNWNRGGWESVSLTMSQHRAYLIPPIIDAYQGKRSQVRASQGGEASGQWCHVNAMMLIPNTFSSEHILGNLRYCRMEYCWLEAQDGNMLHAARYFLLFPYGIQVIHIHE